MNDRRSIALVGCLWVVAMGTMLAAVSIARQVHRALPSMVELETHRLRVQRQGTGSPAIVLETFGRAPLEIWNGVVAELAPETSVFAYDHAGYWGSESGPKPRDARRVATELRMALTRAGVPPPYLLVGYSFGGPYIRVFADLYPREVAGMVFIDPSQEAFLWWLREHFPEINRVTGEDRSREEEWGCQDESMQQAASARIPEVPVTLISATLQRDVIARNLLPPLWRAHARWIEAIPGSKHVIAPEDDHGIVFTNPQLIADEVREMLVRIRGNRTQSVVRGGGR